MSLSPKERLQRTLSRQPVDRPPVICTGGMMNAAVVEVMTASGHILPAGHHDETIMTALAAEVQQATGFENIGVPFCMTVEAEVLGSEIDFGSLSCEPKIARETFPSSRQVVYRPLAELLGAGRIQTVAATVEALARRHPEQPVIASLTGPVSTAASIVDPMQFLRELRKDAEHAHRVLDYVTAFLEGFARLLIEAGAAAVAIGDPTATGEILGPKIFESYAVPYLNRLTGSIRAAGRPAILHICGDLKSVRPQVPQLRADALSTDALVNLAQLKQDFPQLTTMGNISTFLLESGDPAKIERQTAGLVRAGVDIIAPACGLSTASALANIRALTGTVKAG
jgi:[methyl-Co(III) methanol-specific corrinoid protein]:coenzyme M methyltransferase